MPPIHESQGQDLPDDWTAAVLVAKVRAGEQVAFEKLFDLYGSAVYAYLSVVLDDPGDAEDATEDVFAEALEELPEFPSRSVPVRVWLLGIAHEYALELNAIDPSEAEEPDRKQLGEAATLLTTEKSGRVGDEALLSVISRLPAGPREALVLRRMLGLTISEVAEVLDRSAEQAAMLERSAIDSLHDLLRPYNGRPPLPPQRLGMQQRRRESPVACGRRRALVAHTIALLVAAASLPALSALAAQPSSGEPDAGAYVTDGTVHAVAHEPGGPTYIGGDFSHVGPRSGHGLALGAVGSADAAVPRGSADGSLPVPGGAGFPEVAGGEVHAVVSDGNGGWFIGGDFTSVGGAPIPRLAHVLGPAQDSPGQVDTSWAPEPDGAVRALALDSTTSGTAWTLYAGGSFTRLDGSGINRNYLAAWRIDAADGAPASPGDFDGLDGPDPSRDPLKWAPGTNTADGAPVHALATRTMTVEVEGAPTPTSVVFAGGEFKAIGKGTPVPKKRLAAVWGDGAQKTDGTSAEGQVTAWDPGPNTAGSRVTALALGPSVNDAGKTHVPVYWGAESTVAADRLAAARFELTPSNPQGIGGAYTPWAEPPIDGTVRALALDSTAGDNLTGDTTNTLYVGGEFGNVGTTPRAGLAAFKAIPADSIDNSPACTAAVCPANLLDWDPDAQGAVRSLTTSGEGDTSPDATVYAGGGSSLSALTRYSGQADQGTALDWDPRLAGGSVNALALAGDALYAGGGFFSYAAEPRANLAALGPDGTLLKEFDTGTGCEGAGCADDVRALALAPDGRSLYVGGAFTTVDDDPSDPAAQARAHLAALDVGVPENAAPGDPPEPIGEVVPQWEPNPDGWVLSMDVAGERLYAGGAFDRIGSPEEGVQPTRRRLAALERDTGLLLDWDPNARCVEPNPSCSPYQVLAVEAGCDAVYVGGRFDRIGAVASGDPQPARTNIARLDPLTASVASWDPNPDGNPGAVRALAVHGGTVYAGGSFATLGGAVRPRLAALDAASASATPWNPAPDGMVEALAVSDDGQTVFAGGEFSQIGDAERWGLAAVSASGLGQATAWDPSVREPEAATGAPARSVAEAIAVTGGNVYAGGPFTDVGAGAQRGYAQFTGGLESESSEPPACAVDSSPPGPGPGPPQQADTMAPGLGLPFVTDAGRTLVLALSEAAQVHVELAGSAPGLMPMRRGATCAPDSAKLRAELRRALRAKLRKLSARARARKLGRLIAKRACAAPLAPRSIDATGAPGQNRIALTGAGPLAPGSYRATVTAKDSAGNQAQPVAIDFEVAP